MVHGWGVDRPPAGLLRSTAARRHEVVRLMRAPLWIPPLEGRRSVGAVSFRIGLFGIGFARIGRSVFAA